VCLYKTQYLKNRNKNPANQPPELFDLEVTAWSKAPGEILLQMVPNYRQMIINFFFHNFITPIEGAEDTDEKIKLYIYIYI
jgi:hypothetical protein